MRATRIAAWVLGGVFMAPFVVLGASIWESRRHVEDPAPAGFWSFFWLTVVGAVSVALLQNPRWAWWKFSAWRFKNPEANEPSDALYAVLRVAGLVGVFLVVTASVVLYAEHEQHEARYGLGPEPQQEDRVGALVLGPSRAMML